MTLFSCVPVGKPRMTQSDKWNTRDAVVKYWAFRDQIRAIADKEKYIQTNRLVISFYLPMPYSWSNKKRAEKNGSLHDQKPDIDNLLKGFLDAVALEDCHVASVSATKYWSETGYILAESGHESATRKPSAGRNGFVGAR